MCYLLRIQHYPVKYYVQYSATNKNKITKKYIIYTGGHVEKGEGGLVRSESRLSHA